ncbi:DUF2158 domain-containing protein [Dyadobacter alkalitolerans]|uniref:DUF2158 domain-containing protein n=1 Tax=Dyadobacter alkalitolerans TaxID=492736 RepID=UPI00047B2F9E|nr:DUF2158 domain-containing protein [Dyadobacter alkalitolerans]
MEIGDLVQLKSGAGPWMVVSGIRKNEEYTDVLCEWFAAGKYYSQRIETYLLAKLVGEPKEPFVISEGDVVQIKTEVGPKMVVVSTRDADKGIFCMWWDEDSKAFKKESHRLQILTKIKL